MFCPKKVFGYELGRGWFRLGAPSITGPVHSANEHQNIAYVCQQIRQQRNHARCKLYPVALALDFANVHRYKGATFSMESDSPCKRFHWEVHRISNFRCSRDRKWHRKAEKKTGERPWESVPIETRMHRRVHWVREWDSSIFYQSFNNKEQVTNMSPHL